MPIPDNFPSYFFDILERSKHLINERSVNGENVDWISSYSHSLGETPLLITCMGKMSRAMTVALVQAVQLGSSPDFANSANPAAETGHFAQARQGSYSIGCELLKRGADPNIAV